MGDESPDSSTEERIDRLESVVKAQNETIREMLPGRRAVVAGGAAAALGFGAGSGSASGQSAAGQVGTESEPVDVEAASVNAGSVKTGELNTSSRLADVVVHQVGTDWIANGNETRIDKGTDPSAVLQSALDSLEDDAGLVFAQDLDPASVDVTLDRRETVVYAYNGNEWYQTWSNDGIRFWGTGRDGDYSSIKWYPEQAGSDGNDANVSITAHKKKSDGTLDQHLSIYTSDSTGSTVKRLDLNYGEDLADLKITNIGEYFFQADEYIQRNADGNVVYNYYQDTGDGFISFKPNPASSTDASEFRIFRGVTAEPANFKVYKGDGSGDTAFHMRADFNQIYSFPQFSTGEPITFEDGLTVRELETAPGPPTDGVNLWVEDDGSGNKQLEAKFADGTQKTITDDT